MKLFRLLLLMFVLAASASSKKQSEEKPQPLEDGKEKLSCRNGTEYGVWGDMMRSTNNYVTCPPNHECVRVETNGSVNRVLKKINDTVKVRDITLWKCLPKSQCENVTCSPQLLETLQTAVQKNTSLLNFEYDTKWCEAKCCDTDNCNTNTIRAITSGANLCLKGTEYTYEGTTHERMKENVLCINQKCYRAEAQGSISKDINGTKVISEVPNILVYGCSRNCGKSNKLVCDDVMLRDVKKEIFDHDPTLIEFSATSKCRVMCCDGANCNSSPIPKGHASAIAPSNIIFLLATYFIINALLCWE